MSDVKITVDPNYLDNTIDFEDDQQDAMTKTEHIQSLADQVERLEGVDSEIENAESRLKLLKDFRPEDYLLLIGDPALIGVACSIVSDITNGKYNLLKWDRQERKYYPIKINLYEKGEINE